MNQYINNNGMVQLDAEEGETRMVRQRSDPICSSAGCSQYKHPAPAAEPPRDYPVPDFGQDHDIRDTIENERVASKITGSKWAFKTPESWAKYRNKANDVDYNFAPALDSDITTTISNYGNAKTALGGESLVQQRSDPPCTSLGCPTKLSAAAADEAANIIQYPVGQKLDSDVVHTLSNESLASDQVGHVWNPPTA